MPRRYNKTKRSSRPKRYTSSYVTTATGPKTLIRKLRYCDYANWDPASANAISSLQYSCNGLYDPDTHGVGHQPMGFDQYMAMYDHYKVLSSKISVKFVGEQTVGAEPFVFGIYVDDDVTASPLSACTLIEQGLTSWTIANGGAGAATKSVSKTFNTKSFFGSRHSDIDIGGTDAANPAESAYYKIFCQAINTASADVGRIKAVIQIDYIVEFSERKTLAAS